MTDRGKVLFFDDDPSNVDTSLTTSANATTAGDMEVLLQCPSWLNEGIEGLVITSASKFNCSDFDIASASKFNGCGFDFDIASSKTSSFASFSRVLGADSGVNQPTSASQDVASASQDEANGQAKVPQPAASNSDSGTLPMQGVIETIPEEQTLDWDSNITLDVLHTKEMTSEAQIIEKQVLKGRKVDRNQAAQSDHASSHRRDIPRHGCN